MKILFVFECKDTAYFWIDQEKSDFFDVFLEKNVIFHKKNTKIQKKLVILQVF